MEQGERQVAPTLDGFREDHLARYHFAAQRLAGKKVVDAGCGVGYGSFILAEAGCNVLARTGTSVRVTGKCRPFTGYIEHLAL